MHDPAAATAIQPAIATARFTSAVHSLCCAIAGFALLAGARAFMFIALLGWREPVLGGAGLLLLALFGWMRWQCGGGAIWSASRAVRAVRAGAQAANPACGRRTLPSRDARNVACYNRSLECDSKRWHVFVEPNACRVGSARTRP